MQLLNNSVIMLRKNNNWRIMESKNRFIKGIIKGSHISIGYIPIGISFGLIAKALDIPNEVVILMSLIVYAGASQFMAVGLMSTGIGMVEIVLTTFIVNLRHLLMSASLSQRIYKRTDEKFLPLIAFGITDETFAYISMADQEELSDRWILGINIIAYISWVLSTILGLYLSASLPQIIQSSMGISLYAMFIGLLVPNIKSNKVLMSITMISIITSSILYFTPIISQNITSGWRVIITILFSSSLGAFIFEEEVNAIE